MNNLRLGRARLFEMMHGGGGGAGLSSRIMGNGIESYEQLLVLDDNIATPVPENLIKLLPTSTFT